MATSFRNYPENHQQLRSVSASDIIMVLQTETTRVGLSRLSFTPEDTETHSLHSGGAMAMHVAGVPYRTLMDIGRCFLLGFMVYIQQQISSFSVVVSVKHL